MIIYRKCNIISRFIPNHYSRFIFNWIKVYNVRLWTEAKAIKSNLLQSHAAAPLYINMYVHILPNYWILMIFKFTVKLPKSECKTEKHCIGQEQAVPWLFVVVFILSWSWQLSCHVVTTRLLLNTPWQLPRNDFWTAIDPTRDRDNLNNSCHAI